VQTFERRNAVTVRAWVQANGIQRLKSLLLTQGSTTHSQNPLLYTGNVGDRLGEEEGDLLPPVLLGRLPNLAHQARFAAFVTGLTEALADPYRQALVTDALSPLQERALRLASEGDG